MKTILVPTEPHDSMRSVLETALLTGRKFNSHIEGFALRPAIGNIVTMDPVNSLTIVSLRENDLELVKQSRGIFESFMREKQSAPLSRMHGLTERRTATTSSAAMAVFSTRSYWAGREEAGKARA
jgi:hypothetical protein